MKQLIILVLALNFAYSYASVQITQNSLSLGEPVAACKGEGLRGYFYEETSNIWKGKAGTGRFLLLDGHKSIDIYETQVRFDSDDYPIMDVEELDFSVMISDEDITFASISHKGEHHKVSCYLKVN